MKEEKLDTVNGPFENHTNAYDTIDCPCIEFYKNWFIRIGELFSMLMEKNF